MKLPDGWKKVRLEKVSLIQTGIAKNQSNSGQDMELPYLRVANVQDGFLDLSEVKTISIKAERVSRYKLEYGDVLLTEGGDFDKLGRGAVWCGQIENCVHQNHVFVVRPNKKEILSVFLAAQTGSSYGKRYFLSCSKQSTNLASINSSQLKAFPVLLPPLIEQKAIADLLSTWDKAIEKTERLIQAKEKLFKWLLRELIFEAQKLQKNTEWKKLKLGEICKLYQPQTISKEDMCQTGPFKVFGANGVIGFYEKYNHEESEIAITCRGATCGTINITEPKSWITGNAMVAQPNEKKMLKNFLFYSLLVANMKSVISGAAQPQITRQDLAPLNILVPPLESQKQIAETLSFSQNEIDLLKQLAEKYKTQKRGLMQKLLTGRWRVKSKVINRYSDN